MSLKQNEKFEENKLENFQEQLAKRKMENIIKDPLYVIANIHTFTDWELHKLAGLVYAEDDEWIGETKNFELYDLLSNIQINY